MKHFLNWKSTVSKVDGRETGSSIPKEIDSYYKGTLLSRILAMEKKAPISLEKAIQLLIENERAASAAGRKGTEPGHLFWYAFHFVEWIAELGYHIELTGDEFDLYVMSDKVA